MLWQRELGALKTVKSIHYEKVTIYVINCVLLISEVLMRRVKVTSKLLEESM